MTEVCKFLFEGEKKNDRSIPKKIVFQNQEFSVDSKKKIKKTKAGAVVFFASSDNSEHLVLKMISKKKINLGSVEITNNETIKQEFRDSKFPGCGDKILQMLCSRSSDDDLYYLLLFHGFTMDLDEALSLKALSFEEIRLVMFNISSALLCLSKINMMYGDVKPHNILVDVDPETKTIKNSVLFDFDTSQQSVDNKFMTRSMSDGYVSPALFNRLKQEYMSGRNQNVEFNIADDVWSLGIVLYRMVTRRRSPFSTDGIFAKYTLDMSELPTGRGQERRNLYTDFFQQEVQKLFSESVEAQFGKQDAETLIKAFGGMIVFEESKRASLEDTVEIFKDRTETK